MTAFSAWAAERGTGDAARVSLEQNVLGLSAKELIHNAVLYVSVSQSH